MCVGFFVLFNVNVFLHHCFTIEVDFSCTSKLYFSWFECEKSVIFAESNVFPWKDSCTTLSYDY